MSDLDGNGHDADELPSDDTPSEHPDACLPVNRRHVVALLGSLISVKELTSTLTGLVHKVRMTREPLPPELRDEIRDAYAALEVVGRAGKALVSKERDE